MNIPDLMRKLGDLWPDAFRGQDGLKAWAEQYRAALGKAEGQPLATAWRACMLGWDKGYPPKPADIRKHLPAKGQGTGTGPDLKAMTAYAHPRRTELVNDWLSWNQEFVAQARDEGWSGALTNWLRDAAWLLAQREWLYRNGHAIDAPKHPGIDGAAGIPGELMVPDERVAMWRAGLSCRSSRRPST